MRRWAELAATALITAGLAGCASATTSSAVSSSTAATRPGVAMSCVRNPAAAMRRAPTVFLALALAGPSRNGALVSPARMQVLRWIRGHGPRVVQVTTGMSAGGRIAEDQIVPHHGERWRIVSLSRSSPYSTSACLGSTRLPSLVMRPGAPG